MIESKVLFFYLSFFFFFHSLRKGNQPQLAFEEIKNPKSLNSLFLHEQGGMHLYLESTGSL